MHWDTLRTKLTKPIKLSKKWKGPVQSRFLIQLAHLLQEGVEVSRILIRLREERLGENAGYSWRRMAF